MRYQVEGEPPDEDLVLACRSQDELACKFAATYMNHVVTGLHRADITVKANRAWLDMLCQGATYGPAGALGSSAPLTSSFDI